MTTSERWVRTDEAEDVAASVRHATRCWSLVGEDVQALKWFALSLHSALQGSYVGHLASTATPIGAVTKANAKEWLDYLDASRSNPSFPAPTTRLMPLPDLIKCARRPKSAGSADDKVVIEVSDDELRWLNRFHDEIRNQLVHFEPMGWSIEVSGFPAIAKLATRIISDIESYGWAFRHKDALWRSALRRDLAALGSLEFAVTTQ
ncbi:hypothetical protein [Brevundimonas subvibrioides]|uniref:hypothetical protein n=1 Tax=Brevundimonas subvibrioides TaxID=74313 RepID=UPI0022B389F7|nr:hypothetical protein [Brevundimonas subvibrioides]